MKLQSLKESDGGTGEVCLKFSESGKNSAILWIGEQNRPMKFDRKSDFVMDSVINYYRNLEPKLPYEAGRLFLDNGAFTARQNNIELDINRVINLQETFMPDLTIPLDYPFSPGHSESKMEKLWNKTAENITYWQNSTNLSGRLVPTLHAWNRTSLIDNIKWLQKNGDAELIALGSIVNPTFKEFKGFFGDRQPTRELIDMFSLAIDSVLDNSDFKIHLMGWGSSPLMLHLGYYLGMNSLDTMGYRRKAAYGKIILPGTGERHLGDTITGFGGRRIDGQGDPKDIELLNKCKCPICRVNKYELWADWQARAVHNEWVMKQEANLAEHLLHKGIDEYEKYLDSQVFPNSSLKYIWDYVKNRRKYNRISELLFGDR